MGARRDGPSLAHRGWRGVLPRHPHNSTCVRPSVRGIRVAWTIEWLQQKQKQKQKFQTTPNPCGSGLARDGSTLFLQIERGACIAGKPAPTVEICRLQIPPPNRPAGRPPRGAVLLIYQPSREAERRFCGVGRPAWMPGEPRWAMDGPWRRAHGAEPERGNLSAAKAGRQGQAFLVTFSASGKSDSP